MSVNKYIPVGVEILSYGVSEHARSVFEIVQSPLRDF